jgi:8-oxo-dGTP diphosphatase
LPDKVIRAGAYALVTCKEHIVLVEAGQGPYKGMCNLPGGGIEFGESPKETLRRELEEETGLTIYPPPVLVDYLSQTETHPTLPNTQIHLLGYLFRIELATQNPVKAEPDGNDSLGARWIERSELADLNIGRFAKRGVDHWLRGADSG